MTEPLEIVQKGNEGLMSHCGEVHRDEGTTLSIIIGGVVFLAAAVAFAELGNQDAEHSLLGGLPAGAIAFLISEHFLSSRCKSE